MIPFAKWRNLAEIFKKYNDAYPKFSSRKDNIIRYECVSREKWWFFPISTVSCTELQRRNIFRLFLLQNKELALYFLRCIGTCYHRGLCNELGFASKPCCLVKKWLSHLNQFLDLERNAMEYASFPDESLLQPDEIRFNYGRSEYTGWICGSWFVQSWVQLKTLEQKHPWDKDECDPNIANLEIGVDIYSRLSSG